MCTDWVFVAKGVLWLVLFCALPKVVLDEGVMGHCWENVDPSTSSLFAMRSSMSGNSQRVTKIRLKRQVGGKSIKKVSERRTTIVGLYECIMGWGMVIRVH